MTITDTPMLWHEYYYSNQANYHRTSCLYTQGTNTLRRDFDGTVAMQVFQGWYVVDAPSILTVHQGNYISPRFDV